MRALMCQFRLGDHRERFEPQLLAAFKTEDASLNLAHYWSHASRLV